MSGMCQTWRSDFHCLVEMTINSSMAICQVSPSKNTARSSPWGMQGPLFAYIEAHFKRTRYFQKSSERNVFYVSSSYGSNILFFFFPPVSLCSPQQTSWERFTTSTGPWGKKNQLNNITMMIGWRRRFSRRCYWCYLHN